MTVRLTVQDVWSMVPDLKCRGLCTDACTAIGMSHAEHALLPAGFPTVYEMAADMAADVYNYKCPLLIDGRCSKYKVRPLVCRQWGTTESMRCPWGCIPAGGFVSREEAGDLMRVMMEIGGGQA